MYAIRSYYDPIGSRIKGAVKNITDFGIFIGIDEGIDGLVHVSDMHWTKKIRHPQELYNKGDEVEVVVLNIDIEQEKPKISLGIKQLIPDPWSFIPSKYSVGSLVDGIV